MKCLQCKKNIIKGKQFCKQLCETRYKTSKPKYCIICNVFMGNFSDDSRKKTCSNKCRGVLKKHQHQVKNVCLQCNTEFYTSGSRKKTLCSHNCRKIYTSTPDHIKNRTAKSIKVITDRYNGHPFKDPSVIKKIKTTKLLRYNDENYVNPEKAFTTKLIRYNDKNYNNILKAKQTLLQKYGVDNFSKTDLFKKMFFEKVIKRVCIKFDPQFDFTNYDGVDGKKYPFICKTCNSSILASLDNGKDITCSVCNPESLPEKELFEYLTTLNCGDILINTRDIIKPLELDFYIPSKKIAIELNGVFWHSELNGKHKKYHLNKTILCKDHNIQLIHISDNDWKFKQPIIKSILQNYLLPNNNIRVFARKCTIRQLSIHECREFLEENHLQGYAHASIRLGLFNNNTLIQVLTFSRSRFSKNYEYEMIRFCSKKYHTIVGGLKKLFVYFIRSTSPTSIVTFADQRYFTGNGYTKLGFTFSSYTSPNYHYFKNPKILESRLHYQKHKLKNKLSIYDECLSEWENMKNNGYDRIWDCGNSKFTWTSV